MKKLPASQVLKQSAKKLPSTIALLAVAGVGAYVVTAGQAAANPSATTSIAAASAPVATQLAAENSSNEGGHVGDTKAQATAEHASEGEGTEPQHMLLPGSKDNKKDIDTTGSAPQSKRAEGGLVGSGRENLYVPENLEVPKSAEPGKVLYEQGCSSCHGLQGQGSKGVPSLRGAGAAAVDFYMGTGRMPLAQITKQAPRSTPIYTQEQINAIGEYVSSSFGGGPGVPEVDIKNADLARGLQLYANNCAQCHNSAGSGGSLGRGNNAPRLFEATPTEIAEAVRIGPGAMPRFSPETFDQSQLNDIVAYVHHFGHEHPGGVLTLGSTGPVPEGYFAWFVGIGAMLLFARWIGTRV